MDNDRVINVLNDLIETCKDGEYGFNSCAQHAHRADLRQFLANRASVCWSAALELQALVTQLGGKAADSGTVGGTLHRGWVAVKSTLAGYSDLALLEACERGEDIALDRYHHALAEDLPGGVLLIVQQQYNGVKNNHAQIRAMRDEARGASHA